VDDVNKVITRKLPQKCGLCCFSLSNYQLSTIGPVKSQGLSVISKKAAYADVTRACRRIADGAMMKKTWMGFDQFMSLADALMDGLVVTDLHGGILDVNRAASEKLCGKEQDLVGTRLTRFITVEDLPRFARHWQDLISDRVQLRVSEYRARQKDGDAISLSIALSILRDSIGRPKNVIAVLRDIPQRKVNEDVLRENEEKYRSLFENESDALIVFDAETQRIEEANLAALELFGYSEEAFLGLTFSDISAEKTQAAESVQELISGLPQGRYVPLGYFRKKGGTIFPGEIRTGAFVSGGRQKIIGVVRDISQRMETEASLSESRSECRELVEKINDVICEIDLNGVIKYISPLIESVLNYTPQELIGRHFSDFVHPDDLRRVENDFREALGGDLKRREYRMVGKTNEIRWVRSSSWLTKKGNQPVGLRGVLIDITETKRMERRFVQAQKMEALGTLAGGIAHDFNNILACIMGYAQLSVDRVKNGTVLADNLTGILNGALRAKTLINQIISFSRPGKEGRRPVSMTPIIKTILEFLKASLPASIEIRQCIRADRDVIEADVTQIQQVLMNLCTNAVQAMDGVGGTLKVGVTNVELVASTPDLDPGILPGSYLKLSVSDTGCGIPPEIRDKVFDPYFTTKDKDHGTGLGLPRVLGIVKKHDGAVGERERGGTWDHRERLFPAVQQGGCGSTASAQSAQHRQRAHPAG